MFFDEWNKTIVLRVLPVVYSQIESANGGVFPALFIERPVSR